MMLSYQNLSIVLLLLFCLYATYTDLREKKSRIFVVTVPSTLGLFVTLSLSCQEIVRFWAV